MSSSDNGGWDGRAFVTAQQAADYLSVHVRTVYRWAAQGRIASHAVAGSRAIRLARTDVEQLLVERERDERDGN